MVPGSGIKLESCCATTLGGVEFVYGNSQARKLDDRAAALGYETLGQGHAEVVAYEIAAASGNERRRIFCELSPCDDCQTRFTETDVEIVYLFAYPGQLEAWKGFHALTATEQIAAVRREAGLGV